MLSEDKKTTIINAAIAAPSADNSQPFQFQWQENNILHLWIDLSRAGKASDNRFILSDIALGAVIENIAIAADELHYAPLTKHEARRWDPSLRVISVDPSTPAVHGL